MWQSLWLDGRLLARLSITFNQCKCGRVHRLNVRAEQTYEHIQFIQPY